VSTSRAAKRQPELTTAGGSGAVPDSLNKPAAEQSAAGFVLFGTACKLQLDFTPMPTLPYHIGNAWFGGMLPATSFAIVASTGDIYAGLWHPIIFASITAVVGFFFLPETKEVDIKTN